MYEVKKKALTWLLSSGAGYVPGRIPRLGFFAPGQRE